MHRQEPPRTGARAVLATGILLGVVMLGVFLFDRQHMFAANFEVYQVAAEATLEGGPLYDTAPERFPDFYYLYPPITIVGFLPFAAFDLWTGFVVHTAMEIAVGLALAAVTIRWAERFRPLSRVDRLLVAGFVIGSIHTVPSMVYGQVNLRMALFVALGLYLLERAHVATDGGLDGIHDQIRSAGRRPGVAGAALAVAALYKVFPAAVGLWLVARRAWWALAGALATGLGALGLGALVFGTGTTRVFFTEALLPRTDADAFVGGLDPAAGYVTVRRPLSLVVPDVSPLVLTALAALVLAPPLAYCYRHLETPRDRLLGAHATVVAVFVFFPSYPLYYVILYATLIPSLYAVRDRLARRLFVAGALLANVVVIGRTLEDIQAVVPPWVGDPLVTVGMPIVTVATPVLVGCLLMLAGCVVHARKGRR